MTGLPPLTGTPAAGQREGLSPAQRRCNLPFTTLGTLFKGRQEFLADLRRNLVREDRAAVAVHGLGGVGKTRAALEYAWRHDKDYTALLFVSAPTAAELRSNLANLAGVLAIESTVTAVDQQVAEVLRWLEAHPGWLLIVDNVDTEDAASEVERLLAKLRAGHVLITSRIANWSAGVEPLELHVLAAADATAFLLERTPHRRRAADDPSAAAAAARELGCLALALEQAGAYINKLRLSFTEYLGRWRQKRPEVLRWHDERLMQYPASVAITWETTFAQLQEPEQRLLQVLAWLAPEPIPLFLFDAQPLSQAIPEPREALAGLAAFSLARFEAAGDAVAVHRLVQEVARSRAAESDRQTELRNRPGHGECRRGGQSSRRSLLADLDPACAPRGRGHGPCRCRGSHGSDVAADERTRTVPEDSLPVPGRGATAPPRTGDRRGVVRPGPPQGRHRPQQPGATVAGHEPAG